MVLLDSARRKTPVPAPARRLLGMGITATLTANVTHGLGHGLIGAAVAAWPAVALVGLYKLLMMVIRSSQVSTDGISGSGRTGDPLQEQVAKVLAEHLGDTWRSLYTRDPRSAPRRPATGSART